MAIDINAYNADFNAFVKFAQDRIATDKTAVARFGGGAAPLDGRTITDDDLYDPELNVCIGANYVRVLSERYGGDPVLVACAYHAGPNNVDYWLYRYSSDHKTLRYSEIPTQSTRDYARKVVDSFAIYSAHYYTDGTAGTAGAAAVVSRSPRAGADL